MLHEKVSVVIVTYNRSKLLGKCITGVLNQSYPINHIYVINNCSTDDTVSVCEEFKNENLSRSINVVNRDLNDGGAGGFNYGIKLATDDDSGLVWVMDDDVVPYPNCLENLAKLSPVSGFIHPMKVFEDGSPFQWLQTMEPYFGIRNTVPIELQSEFLVGTNVGCFEGALISKKTIETIGLPQREYFINEDDTHYGFSASLTTPVLYTSTAKMTKLLPIDGRTAPWKLYYKIRNRIWMMKSIHSKLGISKIVTYIFLPIFVFVWGAKFAFGSLEHFKSYLNGIRDGFFKGIKI